ncbi:MAG: methyltransferase domain-containing protein [Armatimonadetes bacterium]|nr:methyltransferase domain-containing protein [Armatimonadota bacterium]
MNLETAEFLLSPEGEQLLEEAGSLQGSFLTRLTALRKHHSAEIAGAALDLLELRHRASKKFSRADRMFVTREALEQASSEVISTYRAERFSTDGRVLDLACGIGGDTIGLAGRCFVTAVDRDPVRVAMAQRNLEVYGLAERVTFICADVTEIPLEADAAFLDPSRRSDGRRIVKLSQLSPSLEFIRRLAATIPNCAVKLSPATDYSELESLGGEIEFMSESGECKEALVWCGEFSTASRRATVLPGRDTIIYEAVEAIPVRDPGRYIYEPDPAVIRAHLVEHLAARIGAWKLDEQIAYLSSDSLVETPFGTSYEILDSLPFNLKALSRRLRTLDAGRVIVKKRGVPFEPREIEQRLKTAGSRELIVIITRISEKPLALICLPAGVSQPSAE